MLNTPPLQPPGPHAPRRLLPSPDPAWGRGVLCEPPSTQRLSGAYRVPDGKVTARGAAGASPSGTRVSRRQQGRRHTEPAAGAGDGALCPAADLRAPRLSVVPRANPMSACFGSKSLFQQILFLLSCKILIKERAKIISGFLFWQWLPVQILPLKQADGRVTPSSRGHQVQAVAATPAPRRGSCLLSDCGWGGRHTFPAPRWGHHSE